MSAILESLVRRAANRVGLDIHRFRPKSSEMGRLALMLADQNIDIVFDVGANTGQFAKSLRKAGYVQRIVSFEPLSFAHDELLQASRSDPKWDIAVRAAVGDREGELEVHVAGNSVSSSALQMLASHVNAAPGSAYVSKERVRLSRLDKLSSNYLDFGARPFIKIDTQGYEDRVLDGAPKLLGIALGVQLELSLVPLYGEQKLFDALVGRMSTLGYSIWAINPGLCDPRTGRMLQVDTIFFRDTHQGGNSPLTD